MENKQQAKKEWTKPELTVLVRSNPEEAVLSACKGTDASGYATGFRNCIYVPCADCNSMVGS